ncbi:hypothetical protein CMA01_06530 [Carnobacterium maltaromaticum]|nr:hypothetical protein CMA01_06530 [Carnobacterium maltaromaticum]
MRVSKRMRLLRQPQKKLMLPIMTQPINLLADLILNLTVKPYEFLKQAKKLVLEIRIFFVQNNKYNLKNYGMSLKNYKMFI